VTGRSAPLPGEDIARQPYTWLRTIGRRSGEPRTVELWFALEGRTVYVLAGGGHEAAWVRNAMARPEVRLRLGSRTWDAVARLPEPGTDEEHRARRLVAAKYQGWQEGRPLGRWAATALVVAFDLVA
jgi:deazaflavin-dependent oxidoreductase (nitroreductase family)